MHAWIEADAEDVLGHCSFDMLRATYDDHAACQVDGIVERSYYLACCGQTDEFGVDEVRERECGAAIVYAATSSSYFEKVWKCCKRVCVPQELVDEVAQLNRKAPLHFLGHLVVPGLAVWNDRASTHAEERKLTWAAMTVRQLTYPATRCTVLY
jgi:hypothetical protein